MYVSFLSIRYIVAYFLIFSFLFLSSFARASENYLKCDNRFVTIVNPVRSRELWIDKSLKPIKDQYNLIQQDNFSATWLLQYDVFLDQELINEVKTFNPQQEVGVFLEVSSKLASDTRLIYPYAVSWYSPDAVFLSAYTQSERRKLIDKVFSEYRSNFGYYPKSVGAWWIDSYSLNYLKKKYNVRAALIVADQKTTDNYGVWGQWWGVPFYPSKTNILTPASTLDNKQDIVIIQWAQRDLTLAYGEGVNYSNYSLQANDYISRGKTTSYFQNLVFTYLNCQNPLGQVTVGLETGIESIDYISEYRNQLKFLKQLNNLRSSTLSEFVESFMKTYPDFPKSVKLTDSLSTWELDTKQRKNNYLNDLMIYNQDIAFQDYFVADKSNFLDRKLSFKDKKDLAPFVPWFLVIILCAGILAFAKGFIKPWIASTLFILAAYGLLLRSFSQFGWNVYYGVVVPNISIFQLVVVGLSYLITITVFSKLPMFNWLKPNFGMWFVPLSFGFDFFLLSLRVSYISGKYYLGFMTDSLHFVGLSFMRPFQWGFINHDFPAYQAAALLRLRFEDIGKNVLLSLVIYPFFHIMAGFVIGRVLLFLPKRVRVVIIVLLTVLFLGYLNVLLDADPRFATPTF